MRDDSQEVWKDIQNEIGDDTASTFRLHPALAIGLGGAFLLNVGVLLSLPPVLRGKGAPYLPSFQKKLNVMFTQLRKDTNIAQRLGEKTPLRFVDLGSGDGRVVFRAAREGIFVKSIGYEINPCKLNTVVSFNMLGEHAFWYKHNSTQHNFLYTSVLHLFAQSRRWLQAPKYLRSTDFMMRDLWKVNLANVDVVAVYGLNPIMRELGKKLQSELKPGSVVLSNVFSIPGWRPSSLSSDGVYLYSVPSCWETFDAAASREKDSGEGK